MALRRDITAMVFLSGVALLPGCTLRKSACVQLTILNRRADNTNVDIEITNSSNSTIFHENYTIGGTDDSTIPVEITEQCIFEGHNGDNFVVKVIEDGSQKTFNYQITCADQKIDDKIYIELVENDDIEMDNSICM